MVLTSECSIIPAQSLVQLCLPEGYLRRCDVGIIHPGSIITSGIFLQYKEKCRLLTQVIVKNIFILFIIIIENIWGTRKGNYKLNSESDPIEFPVLLYCDSSRVTHCSSYILEYVWKELK